MPKQSAGILLYRKSAEIQVLLVHPGGPLFARKDLGVWSVPKGEFLENEDPLVAAQREFKEETGQSISGSFMPLNSIKQKGGKTVYAWAVEGSINENEIVSNTFEMQWPPKSQKIQTFPEIDRAEWFNLDEAKKKINERQISFLDELRILLEN